MWANSPVSKMTASNSPPPAHLTQLFLLHRSRCWFCFSKPMKKCKVRSLPKAPWALQTLLLIFAWCSHHSSSFPSSPSFTCLPILLPLWWCFCRGCVSCLQRAWVIHHGTGVNGFWLPFWGHHDPWGTRPLTQNDTKPQVHLTGYQKRRIQECDSRKTEREPDRHRQWVYRLESTWSKRTAVLNIFLCNVQSLVH